MKATKPITELTSHQILSELTHLCSEASIYQESSINISYKKRIGQKVGKSSLFFH